MFFNQHRYSNLITPISYLIDLAVLNMFLYVLPINIQTPILLHSYITIAWIVLSLKVEFYKIYRFAKVTYIIKLLFTQFVFFFLILYAFIGFFKQPNMSRLALAEYFAFVFAAISFIKLLSYFLLMEYRERVKGNLRNVVIVGKNKKTDQLRTVFTERSGYGYNFLRQFSPKGGIFDLQ